VLCASPEYLARHGEPKTPADLATHVFTVLVTSTATFNQFDFVRGDERFTHTVPLGDAWETNDGALSRAWALAGQGIAHKSIWDIAADVRSGALKILLADWCSNEAAVHAVFHGNRYMAPRVRVLLDFLIERFARATAELLGDLAYPPGQQGHEVERTL
jgi:DNA-binding transcriptional LysR family regulator